LVFRISANDRGHARPGAKSPMKSSPKQMNCVIRHPVRQRLVSIMSPPFFVPKTSL
jgi:hypothetical protein